MNKVIFPLDRAKLIAPDVIAIVVWQEPRGVDGWVVRIEYANGRHEMFPVDNVDDMLKETEKAIIKQLKYHKRHKRAEQVSEKAALYKTK